jgi:transcriptional regulator with XRE-family HTH domain
MASTESEFDFEGFYRALDVTRESRKLTWKQVAAETKVNQSTLTRMAQKKRPDADGLASLSAWSGLNPAEFVQRSGHQNKPAEALARISRILREDRRLSEDAAKSMEGIIKAAYAQLSAKK